MVEKKLEIVYQNKIKEIFVTFSIIKSNIKGLGKWWLNKTIGYQKQTQELQNSRIKEGKFNDIKRLIEL